MRRKDKYGRGSAAANGEGFVDLMPGDTFAALEEQLKRRIAERFDNLALGISASIGSKRNASELAKHLASGEEEEAHKFAAKNIGVLFARGQLGISHDDKKAVDETREKPKIFRVFSPFVFAEEPLVATITIKPAADGLRLYAIEALDIMRGERLEVHLAAEPRQSKTSRLLLTNRISYYVGDVNRTHPKFVGRDEMFSTERTVKFLEGIVQDFCAKHQPPIINHQSPTFSIIIPVYNVAPYLRECLDSVLAQTFTDWEAICVDDGSTDGSGAILDEYAARDKRFCVIHQANAGQSMARNAALEIATGEWLFYLDSDDVLSPWALETYVKMMEKYPRADILRAGMATNTGGAWDWGAASGESRGIDVHGHMSMYGLDGYFQRMAYKRVVHGDIRFVGVGWGEDRLYVAKCLARAKYVTDTSVVAYGFRVREGSITHRKMTLEEWAGFMARTLEMAHVCAASGKMVDGRLIRSIVNQLLEDQLAIIYSFMAKEFRDIAWAKWFALLPDVCSIRGMTHWQKFVTRMCMLLQVRLVPLVLCWFPHWLKTKGVHR